MELALNINLPAKQLGWLQAKFNMIYNILVQRPVIIQHSVRTTCLAVLLGEELGLGSSELEILSHGTLVHDIGKTYWPESFCTKPLLDEDEIVFVRFHCEAGYKLLINCGFPEEMSRIALEHHEKIDGRGYPGQLVDKEIGLYAKITAVADCYEALTGEREYRERNYRSSEAITIIKEDQGYSPEIVQVLKYLVKSGNII